MLAFFTALALLVAYALPCRAQSNGSSTMWGTASALAPRQSGDSAATHKDAAALAGAVNAAQAKLLIGPSSTITVQAIGSQSIIATTVTGNGNQISIDATQTTSNTGTTSNNGTIAHPTR